MTLINPYVFAASGGASGPPISNLALWLRPESLGSGGSSVSQWDDDSGNARHATQATSARQPAVLASAKNGHSAVRFDGTDDHLAGSAWSLGNEMIFMVMCVRSSPAAGEGFFCRSNNTENDWQSWNGIAIENDSGGNWRTVYGYAVGVDGVAAIARPVDGTWAIYEHTLNSGTLRVAYNRAAGASTDPYAIQPGSPTKYAIATRVLGGAPSVNSGHAAQIDVAEIVAYNAYNTTTRTDALDYLSTKYAITLT